MTKLRFNSSTAFGSNYGGQGTSWNFSVTATVGGTPTPTTITKTYRVPLGMVANGVNGSNFWLLNKKQITAGGRGRPLFQLSRKNNK